MKHICAQLVNHRLFDQVIVALIILNGIVLGLETSEELDQAYGSSFAIFNQVIVFIFLIEAVLKIVAVVPNLKLYFGNGWNLFDFIVVMFSLIPNAGAFATIARLARLFRVMRLISVLPELRLIVTVLVRSLPGMSHVLVLMSVLMYIYGVLGWHLFHDHDPALWGSLGLSLLTLFRVVTLEDWTDVMYKAMELHPMAWIYFVSFVVIGTFVVVNLFIAMVINNLEEAKVERLEALRGVPTLDDIQQDIEQTQSALKSLQEKIEQLDLKS